MLRPGDAVWSLVRVRNLKQRDGLTCPFVVQLGEMEIIGRPLFQLKTPDGKFFDLISSEDLFLLRLTLPKDLWEKLEIRSESEPAWRSIGNEVPLRSRFEVENSVPTSEKDSKKEAKKS